MNTLPIIFTIGLIFVFASTPGYGGPSKYQSLLPEEHKNSPWADTKVSLHKPFRDLEEEEFDTSDGSIVSEPDLPDNIFPDDSSESDSSSDDDFIESPPYLNSMSTEDQEVRRALDLHSINKSKSSDHPKKKENDHEGKRKGKQTPPKSKPKQKTEKSKNTGIQERKNEEKKEQNEKKNLRNPSTKKSLVKPKAQAPINKPKALRKNQSTGNDNKKEKENPIGQNPRNILKGRVVVRWKEEPRNEIQPSVKSQLLLFFARLRKDIAQIEPVLETNRDPNNSTDEDRQKKITFNVMIARPKNLLQMEKNLIIDERSSEAEITGLEFPGDARGAYRPETEPESEEESEENPAEEILLWQDKRIGHLKKGIKDSSGDPDDDVTDIEHASGTKRGRHEEARNWLKSQRGRSKVLEGSAGNDKKRRKLRPHQVGLEREIEQELAHGAKKSFRKKDSKQSNSDRHRVPTIDQLIAAFDGALPHNQIDADDSREDMDNPIKAHLSDRNEPQRRKKNRKRNNHEHF